MRPAAPTFDAPAAGIICAPGALMSPTEFRRWRRKLIRASGENVAATVADGAREMYRGLRQRGVRRDDARDAAHTVLQVACVAAHQASADTAYRMSKAAARL